MIMNNKLISMIGVCFIAEPFFIQLNNLSLFIESKILGVKCVFVVWLWHLL